MKLKETYLNRYKDVYTFSYDSESDPNKILWQGNFEYCRWGWENGVNPNDNRFNMVDPSGGPYISSGMESTFILKNLKGKYVDYMSANEDDNKKPLSFNIYLKDIKK